MDTWKNAGLRVDCAVGGGVLHMDFCGLVTPGVLNEFCKGGRGSALGAYCLLAMMDKATVAMTAEDFTAPFDFPEMRGKLQMPGGIVCRPCDLAMFQRHARQCAELGVVRTVFTSLESARVWAGEKAQAARLVLLARMGHPSPFQAGAR